MADYIQIAPDRWLTACSDPAEIKEWIQRERAEIERDRAKLNRRAFEEWKASTFVQRPYKRPIFRPRKDYVYVD